MSTERSEYDIAEVEKRALESAESLAPQARDTGELQPWLELERVERRGSYPHTEIIVALHDSRRGERVELDFPVWYEVPGEQPRERWDPTSFWVALIEAE